MYTVHVAPIHTHMYSTAQWLIHVCTRIVHICNSEKVRAIIIQYLLVLPCATAIAQNILCTQVCRSVCTVYSHNIVHMYCNKKRPPAQYNVVAHNNNTSPVYSTCMCVYKIAGEQSCTCTCTWKICV